MFSATTFGSLGHSLAKRAFTEDAPKDFNFDFPLVFTLLVDLLIFLPVFVIIGYTLGAVYPTLAAVEDPLPAYDILPMNDDDDTPKDDNDPFHARRGATGKPITSSLRATNRLLCSTGSWRANFRGMGLAAIMSIPTGLTAGATSLAPVLSIRLLNLLVLLAIAPLATAWTHVVIAAPAPHKSIFTRMRPVGKIYLATWFPTFLLWAATHASMLFPALLARAIGLSQLTYPSAEPGTPPMQGSDVGKLLCVLGVTIAAQFLLVIPADAALARVQASLLPADEDTLVPFDRSFAGRVEPEVVSGKGFATFGAAIKTIPFSGWVRLFMLRVKVFFLAMAAYFVMIAVIAVQMLLLARRAKKGGDGGDGQ